MGPQLASAAWTAGITLVVVFIAIVATGFWLLARRKARGQGPDTFGAQQQRANILLVRVDDAVKNAEDELGFAVAQFGDGKAGEFEKVLITAKSQLTEAFGLQQKLDDAYPDTVTQRRDWSARIIHLCETAEAALAEQESEFAGLRQLEKNAPANLSAVRAVITSLDEKAAAASETFAALKSAYSDTATAPVADNLLRAETERRQAVAAADDALAALDATGATATSGTTTGGSATGDTATGADDRTAAGPPSAGPGITAATGTTAPSGRTAADAIRTAEEHAHRAIRLLDAIGTLQTELGKASDAVTALRKATQENLAEARALRDAPPDADSSAAIARAIETVEAALAARQPLSDPLASLEILRAANAELDTSMAGARNQQRRLDGARTALVGALVGARSQLSATRDFITTRRGGVGTEARTRLAEAERLLTLAEAESDPVAALDIARSSATYSRDADALARYDLMGR